MTTSARAKSPRKRAEHPTASLQAAAAWLRALRRPRREVWLFLEVLRLADMLKLEEAHTRSAESAARKRAERLWRRAVRLEAEAPDFFEIQRKRMGDKPEEWRARHLLGRVYRVLRAFPEHAAAATRFTRATNAVPGMLAPGHMDETTARGTLHAALLGIAARCVGIKQPSGLQAAVLAVAVGMKGEDAVQNDNQQWEAEARWKARFRLVEHRVEEALLAATLDPRQGTVFGGDVKPGTRKGR